MPNQHTNHNFPLPQHNILGQRFGRLTITRLIGKVNGFYRWEATCDCGNITQDRTSLFRDGTRISCGCARIKHGHNRTPVFYSYWGMIQRCYNPTHKSFKDYGGRGITICERWRESFANFLEDMGEPTPPRSQIGRINNDGNYEPSNCRWETRSEQARNRRSNYLVTFRGKTLPITEWAERVNQDYGVVYNRIKRGWAPERALLEPKHPIGFQRKG